MSLIPPHLPSPAPTPDEMNPSPTATAQSTEIEQARLRADLEAQLLRLSQDLYEMEICAGEVGANMEDAVPNYLMRVNQAFVGLSETARRMTDSVPRQVIDNVDHYRNPHTYTKNALTRATGENQYALGRALGLESFRRQLHAAISDTFPTVPLPERRHEPPHEVMRADEGEAKVNGKTEGAKQEHGEKVISSSEDPTQIIPLEAHQTMPNGNPP